MSNVDIMNCLYKQKEILESRGYTVAYICLYGSQNYGLDIHTEEYQSDIDMKAIVVPTLDDLVRNSKPVSTTVETEWGQCDVKDIRPYFQTLLKANPSYVETLYTKHYVIDYNFRNEFERIFDMKDKLFETLSAQFVRGMYGMICEKEKALCHPYPSIAHKVEKYGYDGKQSSHILRLLRMMEDYFINNYVLDDCLTPPPKDIEMIMNMKLNKPSLEETKQLVAEWVGKAKVIRDDALNHIDEKTIDYSIKDEFLSLSQDIIKNKIVIECRK